MSTYYHEGQNRALQVRKLFTKIARRYDFLNDLQSLGFHRLWKQKTIVDIPSKPGSQILDLACGSGDLAFRVHQRNPENKVVGGDYTFPMLQVAASRSQSLTSKFKNWVNLDASLLPFKNGTFDGVTIGYGLRNMADPLKVLQEISRVTKPGGVIAILDCGKPSNPIIASFYYFFLRTIQPTLGWLFFGDSQTYRYLYESLMKYSAQEGVLRLLNETGFTNVRCQNLALGSMSIHTAVKK